MQTAAALDGFDTEPDGRVHILDPGVRIRSSADLAVHQRIGAPLRMIGDQLVTDPAWTAIEIARTLRRPRALLVHADGRSESPMESEARLVFIDGELPQAELQCEIVCRHGRLWRVDFAWPECGVVAENESMEWHASAEALRHDRTKVARLQELGWTSIPLVVDDVRRYPDQLVARMPGQFERAKLAG